MNKTVIVVVVTVIVALVAIVGYLLTSKTSSVTQTSTQTSIATQTLTSTQNSVINLSTLYPNDTAIINTTKTITINKGGNYSFKIVNEQGVENDFYYFGLKLIFANSTMKKEIDLGWQMIIEELEKAIDRLNKYIETLILGTGRKFEKVNDGAIQGGVGTTRS